MRKILTTIFCLTACLLVAAQGNSYNIVFIGNSITYGALHSRREATAPPTVCSRWLSQQDGVDSVYFQNCGRSGRTTYHFLPNAADVVPAGDKTYFGDVVSKTRDLTEAHPGLPLIFSIMLGTNDSAERPRNHRTTPENYVSNMVSIIHGLHERWPDAHVVLQRPTYYSPGIHTQGGSLLNDTSLYMLTTYYKHFQQIISQCEPGKVHIGDHKAYGYFKKHYRTDIFEEKGADGKAFWLHPNEQGAGQLGVFWGKAILKVLTQIRNTPVPVILTAGQSNADGRVPLADKPDYLTYRHCLWSYGSGDFEQASGIFSPYSPRVAKPKIEASWGFDAVVYHLLEQQWQRPFFVIKQTVGGTAIDTSCKSSTHGQFWSADPAFLASDKSLLAALCRQISDCLRHLPANYDIKVLLWHQGESDQKAAGRYHDNLRQVVAYVRDYLVKATGKKRYKHLPVVCGTFAKDSKLGSPEVAEALRQLAAEDPDFHVVEATDLSLLRDQLHFDAKGAEQLGRRYFDKLIELGITSLK